MREEQTMSAKDDFELVRQACETLEAVLPAEKRADDAVEAFKRLFTPRPLRELVADGWTRFQTVSYKSDVGDFFNEPSLLLELIDGEIWRTGNKYPLGYDDFANLPAIPILTPDDMGVKCS
jgi:hypothetical protein